MDDAKMRERLNFHPLVQCINFKDKSFLLSATQASVIFLTPGSLLVNDHSVLKLHHKRYSTCMYTYSTHSSVLVCTISTVLIIDSIILGHETQSLCYPLKEILRPNKPGTGQTPTLQGKYGCDWQGGFRTANNVFHRFNTKPNQPNLPTNFNASVHFS